LAAAKLDVKVARAEFSLLLVFQLGGIMLSKRLSYLSHQHHYCWQETWRQQMLLKLKFSSANARQIQAMYNYERVILNAFRSVKSTFKY
jgi:outer membrane protein TolC